jgi:ice-binding like protein/Big-like domain-containing protein
LTITLRSAASRIAPVAFGALVLLAACDSSPGSANAPGSAPTVSSTNPADVAIGVPTNAKLLATFSEAMDPASLTTATVLLKQGTTAVAGAVAVGTDNLTLTFTPTASLPASTVFTATITAGAKAAAGPALAADHTWSFTTGTSADTTPPLVSGTNPASGGTGVPINTKVTATFDEAMDPASLTAASFVVSQGATPVAGAVSYGAVGTTAAFTPASSLAPNTLFTATIGTGSKDLAGNALAIAHSWTFTTGAVAAKGPAPVRLGTAGNYVVLAKTGISTVPASVVTGDIAVSPNVLASITGFSLTADASNVFSTSPQVIGKVFAANSAVPTPSNLTTAVSNMEAAYTDAAGRPTPDHLELGTGNIGGMTLAPGLYKWTSTVTIPADVVLDGGANDVWIFQTSKDLTMAAAKRVTLSGGALAKNVFWQVAGIATFGAGSHFEGVVLAKTDIKLLTGATMNGRALSQTQVVLQQATLTQPAP